MDVIQHRKSSIFRAVILVALLEFSFVEKSLSDKNICGDRNRRRISYFTLGLRSEDVNWTMAWRKCNRPNKNFTLPVICNQHEHDAFVKYLRENASYPSAWTSGRKVAFDDWKWFDGQSFMSIDAIPVHHESYTRVYVSQTRNYTADDPRRSRYYLCYNAGSSCMYENDIQEKTGCIRPSNDTRSWFDARNQCVVNGGDLAKVEEEDLITLRRSGKLNADNQYWIGLGNNTWRWMRPKAEPANDSGVEVKYTNWGSNQPESRECISISASNGGWSSVSCTERNKVVCQAYVGSDETTSSITTSSTMITSMTTSSSTPPSTRSTRTMSIYSGIGAGIAILIICIIVIIFVVKYKRKPHKDTNQSNVKNKSDQNGIDLSPNIPVTSPAKAPANVPVSPLVAGTDDAQGVYADIALAPLNHTEDEDKIQQPGVVYAALEFQKEPTYLEPNHKNANASDQTKAGPMGDIYAIPDAKCRTGNEAANHPVMVTAQGDVYALPLNNSKSPTANFPVGGIYANL